MAFPLIQPWLKTLAQHPRRVAALLIFAWLAWIGWQAQAWMFDRVLSEADVSARRLQVNRQLFDQLSQRLETYHHPAPSPSLNVNPFRLNQTASEPNQ